MIQDDIAFILRPYNDSDADLMAVLQVYRQCEDFLALGPVATASVEMVKADLALSEKAGGEFNLICSARTGAVWGIVDFVASGYEGDPEVASLSLLMIGAPYRGHGLGEAVVREVEKRMCAGGGRKGIDSGVQVNNPKAIRFWQRMGYTITSGATPMPDGTVCYHLWKAV